MNKKTLLLIIIGLFSISSVTYFVYKSKNTEKKELYKTKKIKKRDITYTINSTGSIEAENTIKVGSLINGVVKELYVEEDEMVKKGQLLVLLDNGKSDTDVKASYGRVITAKANLKYAEAFLKRQKVMYSKGHISQDTFYQAENQYGQALGALKEAKATYEKASIEYSNTKVLSPIDGVVVKKDVSLGQGVSSFLMPTVLYTIAQDLKKMKVELEVDESSIGDVKVGAKAILTFDTYPNKFFEGEVSEISNGAVVSKGAVSYKSYIYIDNNDLLLRPGMTVHADITVADKNDVLSLPGYVFSINEKMVKFVAEEKKYKFEPITKEKKEAFKASMVNKENPIKTVWVVENNAFVERPIEIGVTDKIYFEVVSGLTGQEDVVVDVEETDQMKMMFKKLFGGGMSK